MSTETYSETALTYGSVLKHVWKIKFFSEHTELLLCGEYVQSNSFSYEGTTLPSFYLVLFPNGVGSNKDSVVLRLMRSSCTTHIFEVNMYILNGQKRTIIGGKKKYMRSESGFLEWIIFLRVSDAFRHALPNDTLTIECEIRLVTKEIASKLEATKFENPEIINELTDSQILVDLFNDQKYCDFKLCVGNRSIGVHKGILAAKCPVFDRMFENEKAERNKNKIDVKDIEYDVLWELVHFIYTGNCVNLDGIADRMIVAAERYGLSELKSMSEESLSSTISVENAADVLLVADLNKAERLKSFVISFIQSHASDVMETAGWNDILQMQPYLIKDTFSSITK